MIRNNKANLVVVGLGALGRRHLESLITLKDNYNIYGVEPRNEAIEDLSLSFGRMATIVSDVSELPDSIEAVVIATTADVRRSVFDGLVEHARIKNVMFEKILFQLPDDYYHVKSVLDSEGIKAWVNCARREWDSYKRMHTKLQQEESFTISISGGRWGLGCNGIHYLDLIRYLSGGGKMSILADYSLPITESKRKGFYEFNGSLYGKCGKCSSFQITCTSDETLPLVVSINTDTFFVVIKESERKAFFINKDSKTIEQEDFAVPYQSQLTARVISSILESGKCDLTSYDESMELHLQYISSVASFFEKNANMGAYGFCPIT